MRCRQVQEKLSAFQDGELKAQEQGRVREHLERCPACRERYQEMEKVWQALGEFKEIFPEPGFYGQVVQKINESDGVPSPAGFRWVFQFFPASRAGATLLIAAILAGTFLGNILVKNDLFPFQGSQAAHSRASIEAFSLKAFDAIPPGTLADNYIRMAGGPQGGCP